MRKTIATLLFLPIIAVAVLTGYSVLKADPDAPKTIEDLGPVCCHAISPDGQRVVSGHEDSRARVWNVASGELVAEFGRERPAVVCASFSPDGRRIVFAHADEFVRIWDLDLKREIKTFQGHTGTIRTVAYMPDGQHVISAGADKTIRLWNIASGMEMHSFVGHGADVNGLAVFDDGHKVISASGDYWGGRVNESSVRVWDTTTGKQIKKFDGEFAPLKGIAITRDGRIAVTCSWKTAIQVWDVNEGKEIRRFGDKYTESIALSQDGRQVVSGAYSLSKAQIKLWSIETGELLAQGPAHASTIHQISFLPDGINVMACSGDWGSRGGKRRTDFLGQPLPDAVDCTLRLWDMKTGEEVRRYNGPVKR
ncbi:MAG: WD40 repeat domain-containing protein [Gemmataceae bacterium]|nr:WD40 repeat domain-containing protein [Gemmataceae bacterium]